MLRLVGPLGDRSFANQGHFFAAAADAMRRILVDSARRKQTMKPRPVVGAQPGSRSTDCSSAPTIDADSWIDLDEALTARSKGSIPPRRNSRKLRIFGGLSGRRGGGSSPRDAASDGISSLDVCKSLADCFDLAEAALGRILETFGTCGSTPCPAVKPWRARSNASRSQARSRPVSSPPRRCRRPIGNPYLHRSMRRRSAVTRCGRTPAGRS